MASIAPFFREGQAKKRGRLSHHTTQPAPPLAPPLELLDEDFVAAWWADLSPRERRAVQEIVSERLYRLEVEWVKGEGRQEEKVLDNVMAGREWYRMRRRVASELIAKETDLAEMIYQAEMSNYE